MSDNLLSLPFCTAENAAPIMRDIAANRTHRLMPTDHAKMRMDERGVSIRQIQRAVKSGDLVEAAKWDTEGGERGWKCKFQMILAGVQVTVVAKLVQDKGEACLIITVWNN